MVKRLVVLVIIVCSGFVVYPLLDSTDKGYQETNAYVVGRVVNLTANRAGRVIEIGVHKGQRVSKGDVLMRLDNALIRYEIEQLQEEIKGFIVEEVELCWDEKMAQKDIERSQNQREYLISRKQRLTQLEQNKALAVEDIRQLDNQITEARIQIERTQDIYRKASERNRLPLLERPRITAALAQLKQKYYQLSLSDIVAPYDGFIYELTTYPGERITTNDRLAVFIPDEELMIEANVLETFIHYFKPGKPVTIYPDVMGRDQSIKGVVHSIVPTVSADLSVLPRNNQDSNWIKVSQRIPVLIKADASRLNGYRLPIGTSVRVNIGANHLASSKGQSGQDALVKLSSNSIQVSIEAPTIETATKLTSSEGLYQQAVIEIFADHSHEQANNPGICL